MVTRVCFIFLDGLGLGPAEETNPLASTAMPTIEHLLGHRLVLSEAQSASSLTFRPIDACLGVDGLPQSATGQATLFTGLNAASAVGRHLPAFPNSELREIVERHSLLKRAVEAGKRATFANAYSPQYWELVKARRLRHSVTTYVNMAAGLRFRDLKDLRRGEAVYWDITHWVMHQRNGTDIPLIEPEQAGRNLALLCRTHDLVLYESFLPDMVGHRRLPMPPSAALELIDRFLGGVLDHLPDDTLLVLTSDHGNIEDMSSKTHTRHPVPLIAYGPGAERLWDVEDLTGVTPAILDVLSGGPA